MHFLILCHPDKSISVSPIDTKGLCNCQKPRQNWTMKHNPFKQSQQNTTKRTLSNFSLALNIFAAAGTQFPKVPKMNYITDYHVIMDLSKDW